MAIRSSRGIDWLSILLCLSIICFGILNIYSVDEAKGIKQAIFLGLGIGLILFLMIANSIIRNLFQTYSWLVYLVCLMLLGGLFLFGKEINGARAWYSFGSFSLQPAEFAKIATGLFLGYVLDLKTHDMRRPSSILFSLFILGLPVFLILLQPDVGSILVFFAFIIALYREGLHWSFLVIPVLGVIVFLIGITIQPMYFLTFLGYIILILITIGLFFIPANQPKLWHLFRGFFLSLVVYFLVLILILVVVNLNNSGVQLVQFNYLMGVNGTLSILFFYLILGVILSTIIFFTLRTSSNENIIAFEPNAHNSRLTKSGFLSGFIMLIIILTLSFSSSFVYQFLPKHQQERIMVLFEGEGKYRDTSGYNLLYSKTAIGSGELKGKGFREGTVKRGSFVPEQSTDYIFCTVGEEWGFLGSSVLLLTYVLFILRLYWLAERQEKVFSRFVGYSLASVILIHFAINIGMVTGLFPTVGIPLPLFSYGGSSLWAFLIFVSIFLIVNYEGKQSLF